MRLKWLTFSALPLLAIASTLAYGFFRDDTPLRFNSKAEMLFPEHYREWVWLTSGLGMSYTPTAHEDPDFDNVFVSPDAYRSFMATGTWPNGSVFVLEVRASHSKGSINQSGHFQGDVQAVEVHVKKQDGAWAFYGFGTDTKPARMIAQDANCYSCHRDHGTVDTTFVQFYPTLLKVAKAKNTYHQDGPVAK